MLLLMIKFATQNGHIFDFTLVRHDNDTLLVLGSI